MSKTASESKPLAQRYNEEVETLTSEGMSNADAIRQVAETHGKPANTIRGSIYRYKAQQSGNGATPRRRGHSVEDHLVRARQSLEAALTAVDEEVTTAKDALESAQARYEQVAASVAERKSEIESKLDALS